MKARLRHAVSLTALLLLGGCAGVGFAPPTRLDPPAAAVPTTPRLIQGAIIADDGARLPLRAWLPKGQVKATILAVHGFNDYSNAFARPATAWARHGIATFAYDQRGFGAAPNRGLWAGTRRLDQDVAVASRLVAAHYPGVPHYLLGESMGGAVVMTAAAQAAGAARPVADGIILVAPAVWGRSEMNIFERAALWTADTFVPNMTLTGGGLGIMASDNIPMLRALSRDPLVIKATRVSTIEGLVNLMSLALATAPRIETPTLLLYGEHDELIPRRAIRALITRLTPRDTPHWRFAWYPQGYHMLLRDLDGRLVRRDVTAWIDDADAPLPSGADRNANLLLAARD